MGSQWGIAIKSSVFGKKPENKLINMSKPLLILDS
jgi:hypothetical protein